MLQDSFCRFVNCNAPYSPNHTSEIIRVRMYPLKKELTQEAFGKPIGYVPGFLPKPEMLAYIWM